MKRSETAPPAIDLTRDELLGIAERIDRALLRRSILPYQSLQYRLGEVGRNRVHPIALQRALKTLARRPTRRSTVAQEFQPWIVAPHVYASPELSDAEADAALTERRADLDYLAAVDWDSGFQAFIRAVEKHTGKLLPIESPQLAADTPLAGDRRIQASEVIYCLRRSRERPVYLWATQQVRWIHPMDPALWQFLTRCAEDDAHPLIIARYIDPSTFVLFKALHVQGLQYYGMWAAEPDAKRATTTAERLGWPYVHPPEKTHSHAIFGQLRRSLDQLSAAPWEDARPMIVSAAASGLGGLGDGEPLTHLLVWARAEGARLPHPWIEALERWSVWLQGGPVKLSRKARKKPARLTNSSQSSTPPPTRHPSPSDPAPEIGEDQEPRGYGRETTVTRVPLRLR